MNAKTKDRVIVTFRDSRVFVKSTFMTPCSLVNWTKSYNNELIYDEDGSTFFFSGAFKLLRASFNARHYVSAVRHFVLWQCKCNYATSVDCPHVVSITNASTLNVVCVHLTSSRLTINCMRSADVAYCVLSIYHIIKDNAFTNVSSILFLGCLLKWDLKVLDALPIVVSWQVRRHRAKLSDAGSTAGLGGHISIVA